MAARLSRRSIISHALLAGGLLIGVALAPAAAQSVSSIDGQVAVRSDGAVYLISNGQRRWVATVAITDEELNAYPEAEPIYSGLAPLGAPAAGSAPAAVGSPSPGTVPPPPPPSAGAPSAVSVTPTTSTTGSAGGLAPIEVGTPTGAVSELDPSIPIEVDIDGTPKYEPGEFIGINLKSKAGVVCELAVKWPNGTEVDQPRQTADAQGRCRYEIEVPATASVGTGTLKGIAREGSKLSRQNVEFEVIPTS